MPTRVVEPFVPGHTIDGIVDEDDGDVFAAVQGVDGFGSTDTSQVAVSLVSEHQAVRPKALDGSGKCGRTSVGGFLPVDVYIIIDEHGTSHGEIPIALSSSPISSITSATSL